MIDRVFAGRYRITEKIGIGGMAEVFKATDETLGRTVAVKVMLPQYASDESFAIRFKQEAQAAANLQSPYIVNIYDWGFEEASQTYYMVMEYVRGTDLKTAITQRGAINQRKVAEIGAQVAAALGVAHSYDIIHRDIKPHNIMVQPDGNAKVMDFGIARANNANMTQTGSVLGTAYYVSPEQAQGRALTAATDIYSLGVVLYEAACGRVPFDGPDAVSIAVKQVNEQPAPPRAVDAAIEPALEAIILKAMQKDPAARFTTAQEMRLALTEFLQGKPLSGVDPEARTRVIRTPAVVPAVEGTAVMPELGGKGTTTRGSAGGGPGARGSAPSGSSSKTPLIIALVAALVVVLVGVAVFFAFCSNSGSPEVEKVEVPNVVGMTKEEAVSALEKVGLKPEITEEVNEKIEPGKVISTDPVALFKVAPGSTVKVKVSKVIETVEVPSLANMTEADARKKLTELGFEFAERSKKPSADVEAGRVIAQDPAAGTKAKKGSKVSVDISSGPDTAFIPSVYGLSASEAEAILAEYGFAVRYTDDVFSSTVAAGYVVKQDKVNEATKGETVTLTLSKGPEPTPTETTNVPNIVGMDVSAASERLRAIGLSLDYTGDPTGKVVSKQTPAAGTTVDKGTSVTAEFS